MNNNISNRDNTWDNIKGFLIFLVVFAHSLYGLQSKEINELIVLMVYFFHMPAFVFVSGYFSKSEKSRGRESISMLIVAYLLIMIPFMIRAMYLGDEVEILTPYFSAWYILALIFWRLITPHIADFKGIVVILTVFALISGFWDNLNVSAFAVKKIIVFYPFFMAGYLLAKDKYQKRYRDIGDLRRKATGLLCLAFAGIMMIISKKYLGTDIDNLLPGAYDKVAYEEPVIRLSIYVVSLLMILAMMYLSSNRNIPFLTKIGRNTLPIYIMHRMFTLWYYQSDLVKDLEARYQILGALVLTLAILVIFGSDIFAGVFNGVVKGMTGVLVGKPVKNAKDRIYKTVTYVILAAIFLAPVIQMFLKL